MNWKKEKLHGRTFEERKKYADILLSIEGNRNDPTIAFYDNSGNNQGCCNVHNLKDDPRAKRCKYKKTTWEKYTYFKTGCITENEL